MIGMLINHLWQSTLFATAVGLLSFAFSKNRAEVRYWLWFVASCKFLVPFSLLISLGKHVEWLPAAKAVAKPVSSFRMEQFTAPFPQASIAAIHTGNAFYLIPLLTILVWLCGFGFITLTRLRGWQRIRAAVKSSVAVSLPAAVEVRCAPGLLEPGVVGFLRPILLLPQGMAESLPAQQLKAVLAHEICHVRRRDNVTAAIHMVAEAIFWFYPLVWWIGARLIEERERACDEAVLEMGNDPHDYAEGILHVCKSYLASPLSCVSGVTSSDIRKRMENILAGSMPRDLTNAKKLILTAAGIATLCLPVLAGMISAPRIRVQSEVPAGTRIFEVASIQSCEAFRRNTPDSWSPGKLRSQCTTVGRLIEQAYGLFSTGHADSGSSLTVTGGPAWTTNDLFEVVAKGQGRESRAAMNGPMMQAFLEDKLKLKFHRENREVPIYRLTVAPGGPKLEPFQGVCTSRDFDDRPSNTDCATARGSGSSFHLKAATMADLCAAFLVLLDRPIRDETGIAGRFNLHLDFSSEDPALVSRPRSLPALRNPIAPEARPISFDAAKEAVKALGLDLESDQGPGNFVVIDQIERP